MVNGEGLPLPLFIMKGKAVIMVTETFSMKVEVVGTDDGTNTYEVRRQWGDGAKKALVIEMYPTITTDKCHNMDISTMHLMNHASDFGWENVRIVNLYSKVFAEKPLANQLTADNENLSYIEALLEDKEIKSYDIVIAWGNTLLTHKTTINAKIDLLSMIKEKGLIEQTKCIVTDDTGIYGVHPLYLGLRHAKDMWKLTDYPVEKMLCELEGGKEETVMPKEKSGKEGATVSKEKNGKGEKKNVSKNNE